MHTPETTRILRNLENAAFLSIPSNLVGEDDTWYKVYWVDGDGTPEGITVAYLDEDDDGEHHSSYADLKAMGAVFYQYARFNPEADDVMSLV